MSKDWDVDSYKNAYENKEHWELRKKFMLAHKDKFEEDELVCLAQVFTNIEFLGCRYPDQTMIKVAELAKGVVEQFREKRKNSLKRTFVSASEAISAKVKGQTYSHIACERAVKNKKIPPTKNNIKVNLKPISSSFKIDKKSYLSSQKFNDVKPINIHVKKQSNASHRPLSNFVLFLSPVQTHAVHEIERSVALNSADARWDYEEGTGRLKVCRLYLNGTFIATGFGESLKQSKENTALAALTKLREKFYTVKIKSVFFSTNVVSLSQIGSVSSPKVYEKIDKNNIGRKMLTLMGWQGGGLGRQEQGIEEPIATSMQVWRKGFGQGKSSANLVEFKQKTKEYIKTWMKSQSDQDLVFSSEFNPDERKIIHDLARKFSLRSKSYGKKNNRHLVLSKRIDPWQIVESLKQAGGNSNKYELLYPTNGGPIY